MKSCPIPNHPLQKILDTIFLPLRTLIFKEEWIERIGLTSLREERIRAVWPYLDGKLLDIGAGTNKLVRLYGNGVGVDVHKSADDVVVVKDAAHLNFESNSFDTVCFLACLNHIPNREEALLEARRMLRPSGKCVVTMINPLIGTINHKVCWYDESHHRRMAEGERNGLWPSEISKLLSDAGFMKIEAISFFYYLNSIYVASKHK